jgi:hypothetical protein
MRRKVGMALACVLCAVGVAPAGAGEPRTGVLDVHETFDQSRGVIVEGYLAYARVVDARGAVVRRQLGDDGRLKLRLAPGSYRLTRFARICEGNCGELSQPGWRCRASLRVRAGGRTVANVRADAEGCAIRVSGPR